MYGKAINSRMSALGSMDRLCSRVINFRVLINSSFVIQAYSTAKYTFIVSYFKKQNTQKFEILQQDTKYNYCSFLQNRPSVTTSVQRYTVNMTAWTMSRETLFELEFGEFPMINLARNGG